MRRGGGWGAGEGWDTSPDLTEPGQTSGAQAEAAVARGMEGGRGDGFLGTDAWGGAGGGVGGRTGLDQDWGGREEWEERAEGGETRGPAGRLE